MDGWMAGPIPGSVDDVRPEVHLQSPSLACYATLLNLEAIHRVFAYYPDNGVCFHGTYVANEGEAVVRVLACEMLQVVLELVFQYPNETQTETNPGRLCWIYHRLCHCLFGYAVSVGRDEIIPTSLQPANAKEQDNAPGTRPTLPVPTFFLIRPAAPPGWSLDIKQVPEEETKPRDWREKQKLNRQFQQLRQQDPLAGDRGSRLGKRRLSEVYRTDLQPRPPTTTRPFSAPSPFRVHPDASSSSRVLPPRSGAPGVGIVHVDDHHIPAGPAGLPFAPLDSLEPFGHSP